MAEDRTQEPSARRLLLARERGQVARSPELTAAATLLAASALLWGVGDALGTGLIDLVRAPWLGDLGVAAGGTPPLDAVAQIQRSVGAVLVPLAILLGGSVVVAVLVHQGQVGGLFVPGLLAPNVSRLWHLNLDEDGGGAGGLARARVGAWSLLKTVVVVALVAWLIRSRLADFYRLGRLEPPALARAAGGLLGSTTLVLGLALMALGGIDYALQRQRFAGLLRMTDEEHRADLRSADGDPTVRARRRALARSRSGGGDDRELLRGASLTVTGPADITIVLAGGPPPRRVSIRSSAHGAAGARLRRAALGQNIPAIDAPDLARALARLRTPAVPGDLLTPLGAAWPDPDADPAGPEA